jgi:hypothetical protein
MLFSMCLVICGVLTVGAGQASAQEPANPSAKEHELNEQAVRAMIAEDYPKAIALLEESRSMGESNVVYLNLGRAYQKLGNCAKAREMLAKVPSAPVVQDPSPELIQKRATRYLKELDEQCEEPPAETAEKTEKPEDATDATTEDSTSASSTDGPGGAGPTDPPSADDEVQPSSGSSVVAFSMLGTGIALGATAVVLEVAANSQRNDIGGDNGDVANYTYQEARDIEARTNRMSTIALGLGIAGAVTAGVGVALWTRETGDTETTVSLGDIQGAPSISLTAHW